MASPPGRPRPHLLALRLVRYDARCKKLATDMKGRGKPGSVVAAAVANRWVQWVCHQMRPVTAAA